MLNGAKAAEEGLHVSFCGPLLHPEDRELLSQQLKI